MIQTQSFVYSPDSVPTARHFVGEALVGLPDETIDLACLIVSELTTNCIRHAGTGFTLSLETSDDHIRIAVTDAGSGRPILKSPSPTEPSGRGLRIVEVLSENWGVIPSAADDGKTVWCIVNCVSLV